MPSEEVPPTGRFPRGSGAMLSSPQAGLKAAAWKPARHFLRALQLQRGSVQCWSHYPHCSSPSKAVSDRGTCTFTEQCLPTLLGKKGDRVQTLLNFRYAHHPYPHWQQFLRPRKTSVLQRTLEQNQTQRTETRVV